MDAFVCLGLSSIYDGFLIKYFGMNDKDEPLDIR